MAKESELAGLFKLNSRLGSKNVSAGVSRERMSELFSDFKKLNVCDPASKNFSDVGTTAKSSSCTVRRAASTAGTNDENRKPLKVISKPKGTLNSRPGSSTSNPNISPGADSLELKVKNFNETKNYSSNYNITSVTLYVGDIDHNVTEKSFLDLFKNYKSLLSAKLCFSPITNMPLGYGYVNFSNGLEAKQAKEDLNYTLLLNKEIRIMPYVKGKDKSFMSTNVFVSNINTENLTLRGFYETFKSAGAILSCKLDIRKRQGFISFEKKDVAERFVKNYDTKCIDGSNIHCSIHIPKSLRNNTTTGFTEKPESRNVLSTILNFKAVLKDTSLPPPLTKSNTLESIKTTVVTPISVNEKSSPVKALKQLASQNSLTGGTKPSSDDNSFNQVYVKGLPIAVNEEEIRTIFEPFGSISDVYVETVPAFKSSWAFVTFKNHQSAVEAITNCHKANYKGRHLTCVKALKKAERHKIVSQTRNKGLTLSQSLISPDNSFVSPILSSNNNLGTKLYIYNLSNSVNENFFKLFLRNYTLDGKVLKYSFQNNSKENFIEFENKSDAVTIHQKLNGVNLSGLLIQTSLVPLGDSAKKSVARKPKISSFPEDSQIRPAIWDQREPARYGSDKTIPKHEGISIERTLNENAFQPFEHHSFIRSGASSPSITNYTLPSPNFPGSAQTQLTGLPSVSSYSTINSPYPDQHTALYGKPYGQFAPAVINDKQHLKAENIHMNYQDLYTTPYETFLSEELQEQLEKLALRQINFLSYPSATRTCNLKKILNFMFLTFWGNDLENVEQAITSIESDPQYELEFKERVIGTIRLLGFER